MFLYMGLKCFVLYVLLSTVHGIFGESALAFDVRSDIFGGKDYSPYIAAKAGMG